MGKKCSDNKDLAKANEAMQRLRLGNSSHPPPEAGLSAQSIHRSSVQAKSQPSTDMNGNVVPFRRVARNELKGKLDRPGHQNPDPRPVVLFDLNGTLTSHTSQRHSSGINKVRPGTHHLRRLQVKNSCSHSLNAQRVKYNAQPSCNVSQHHARMVCF